MPPSQHGMRQAPECLDSVHISVRSRELLKAKNGAFTGALRLRELVHMLLTYNTAGWREAIVSTRPPLPNRFMIKVSTQYAVNLVGILVTYLGLSPIKLLSPVPLISAVRFVGNCHFNNSLCQCRIQIVLAKRRPMRKVKPLHDLSSGQFFS